MCANSLNEDINAGKRCANVPPWFGIQSRQNLLLTPLCMLVDWPTRQALKPGILCLAPPAGRAFSQKKNL
jgi:hypothetical protein